MNSVTQRMVTCDVSDQLKDMCNYLTLFRLITEPVPSLKNHTVPSFLFTPPGSSVQGEEHSQPTCQQCSHLKNKSTILSEIPSRDTVWTHA